MKKSLVILLFALTLRPASALYWDANGSAPGAGGPTPTGTWGVDAYWNTDYLGTNTTQGWDYSQVAVFSAGTDATGPFTVNVSGNQSAQWLSFEEGIVTLSGGSLSLTEASGLVTVGFWATAIIDSELASAGGLAKEGPGTLILMRANTYAGSTVIREGVLQLGASGVIPSGSPLVIMNNSTARSTFATGGFSQNLGALSVQGADPNPQRVIDFGSGASALTFADSSGEDWNGMPLLLVNYTPGVDSLRFGTSSAGLTATQLGLIRFVDFAEAPGQIDAGGFVTPVLPANPWTQLTWAAADNRTYRVQYKDHLTDANWVDLSPAVVALGPTASTIDASATGSPRFYRVAVLP
jgi:autotransporter-associated beta strand protein